MWGVLTSVGVALFQWALPRLLACFGVVVVSQTVFTPAFSYLQGKITSNISAMGADVADFLQYCGVQDAISVVFAAYTLKLSIRAAKAASAKAASTNA